MIEHAKGAVYAVFALAGAAFAAFASRIPEIKAILDLSAGELGISLLAASLGSLLGLPAAGWFVHRIGAARTVGAGVIIGMIGILTIGLGVDVFASRWIVTAGLWGVGLGVGSWDVAMNIEGAVVERHLGRAIMPRFHAAFSGGTVISALIGAAMAAIGARLLPHLIGIIVLVVTVATWALPKFLPRQAHDVPQDAGAHPADAVEGIVEPAARQGSGIAAAWREPRTILIGCVTLVAAFTEGTANDWLSVAFVEGYHLPPWAGVLGFATFLTFMTIGRILGTSLIDRHGRVVMVRGTFVMAVVGAAMVIFGGPALAFAGAALWGLGASLGFPVGMSAAADDPRMAAARVSVVSTIGYLAFLGGPPILGFLGDHIGVLRSLTVVGGMVALALLAVPAVRESDSAVR